METMIDLAFYYELLFAYTYMPDINTVSFNRKQLVFLIENSNKLPIFIK